MDWARMLACITGIVDQELLLLQPEWMAPGYAPRKAIILKQSAHHTPFIFL